jgi:hypothetical protein
VGKLAQGNDTDELKLYSPSSIMFVDYDIITTTTTLDQEDTAFYEKERDTESKKRGRK